MMVFATYPLEIVGCPPHRLILKMKTIFLIFIISLFRGGERSDPSTSRRSQHDGDWHFKALICVRHSRCPIQVSSNRTLRKKWILYCTKGCQKKIRILSFIWCLIFYGECSFFISQYTWESFHFQNWTHIEHFFLHLWRDNSPFYCLVYGQNPSSIDFLSGLILKKLFGQIKKQVKPRVTTTSRANLFLKPCLLKFLIL